MPGVPRRQLSYLFLDGCERSFVPMAARVPAHGPRRRTAIAATLALTALVGAPLLETTLVGQSAAAPAAASGRAARLRRDLPHQGRGPEPLTGHGDLELPDRRPRPAPHQLAEHARRRRLGEEAARELRPVERRARSLGPVRPRLGQRADAGDDDRAAVVPAARLPEGVDAGHQRPRSRATPSSPSSRRPTTSRSGKAS